MAQGSRTPVDVRDEIVKGVLSGEASQAVADRLGLTMSTVLHWSAVPVEETLRPRLLIYLSDAGKVDRPGSIPTHISRRYGIHRTVHVLEVLRKEGLISARQAGGSRNLRDIELTDKGQDAAFEARRNLNGHAQEVALTQVDDLTPEETANVERLSALARQGHFVRVTENPNPEWPILARLRARITKRAERARLLEAAAELADDDTEGVQLLEAAEKARAGANTPIEDEYLAFAEAHA